MRSILIWILILGYAALASAQADSLHTVEVDYFSGIDALNIDVVKQNDEHLAFVQYELKPKNTLYSISKYFHVQIGAILKYNPQLTQKMPQLGDILQIPIKIQDLKTQATEDQQQLPVFYQVKKGETLYTISKVYFQESVSDFSQRAGIEHANLSPNQLLFLGYFNLNPTVATGADTTQVVTENVDKFVETYGAENIIGNRGIAFWRSSKNKGKTFALHRVAKVGSYIEVINPMFKSKIYAKVVGRLPKGAYTDDIMIVLSPKAAKSLGALDARFYVKVRYIK